MADPSSPFNQVAQNTAAQKRAALSAMAQAGSAGQAAFNGAQAQLAAQRQAALGAAAKRSGLIGGPEAAVGNYVAPINASYGAGQKLMASNAAGFGQMTRDLGAANANYFDQVRAAVPISEAATNMSIAASAAKAKNKMTQAEKDAEIIGSTEQAITEQNTSNSKKQQDQKVAQAAVDKKLSDTKAARDKAYQAYWNYHKQNDSSYSTDAYGNPTSFQGSSLDKNKAKSLLQAATKLDKQATQLEKARKVAAPKLTAPDPYKIAQENAVKQGYTPEQASVLYGQGGTHAGEYLKRATAGEQAKLNSWSSGGEVPSEIADAAGIKLVKGRLAQEDLPTFLDATDLSPDQKEYLISNYARKFKTRKQLKKAY